MNRNIRGNMQNLWSLPNPSPQRRIDFTSSTNDDESSCTLSLSLHAVCEKLFSNNSGNVWYNRRERIPRYELSQVLEPVVELPLTLTYADDSEELQEQPRRKRVLPKSRMISKSRSRANQNKRRGFKKLWKRLSSARKTTFHVVGCTENAIGLFNPTALNMKTILGDNVRLLVSERKPLKLNKQSSSTKRDSRDLAWPRLFNAIEPTIDNEAMKAWISFQNARDGSKEYTVIDWVQAEPIQKLAFLWSTVSGCPLSEDPFENFLVSFRRHHQLGSVSHANVLERARLVWVKSSYLERLPYIVEAFIMNASKGNVDLSDEEAIRDMMGHLKGSN